MVTVMVAEGVFVLGWKGVGEIVAVVVAVGVLVTVAVNVVVPVNTRGVRLGVDVGGVPVMVEVVVGVPRPGSGARLKAINPAQ